MHWTPKTHKTVFEKIEEKSPFCLILYWISGFFVLGAKIQIFRKWDSFESIFVHCAIIHTQSAKMCKSSPKISLKIIIIWWPFSAYLKWSHKNRTERWNGIVWIQCQWRTNWVGYSCHYCNTMSNRFFAFTGWTNDMWTKFRWTLWVNVFMNSTKNCKVGFSTQNACISSVHWLLLKWMCFRAGFHREDGILIRTPLGDQIKPISMHFS